MSRQISPIRRLVFKTYEWDPADHDGEHETWESMTARLEAAMPSLLEAQAAQPCGMGRPETRHDVNPATERRSVYRAVWAVSTKVPAHIAERIDPDTLPGVIEYEEDVTDG